MNHANTQNTLSREAFYRMMVIIDLVDRDTYPTCKVIATQLEVTERTVRRDLDSLRLCGYAIGYDAFAGGYAFEDRPTKRELEKARRLMVQLSKRFYLGSADIATVRFTGRAAKNFLQTKSMPYSQIRLLSEQAIEVDFVLEDAEMLAGWVVTCGKDAQVLGPVHFQETVKEAVADLLSYHNSFAA
jgi:predicted DNA-binding transcriptional regulator YafY